MEPGTSSPCLIDADTVPYPEPDESI